MKKFKPTKHNREALNRISKDLKPIILFHPIEINNAIKKHLYNIWKSLVKLSWPNKEPLIGQKTFFFITTKIFKLPYSFKSHIGYLIRCYEQNGAGEVAQYLLKKKMPINNISNHLNAMKLSNQNLETVKIVEKRFKIKLLK